MKFGIAKAAMLLLAFAILGSTGAVSAQREIEARPQDALCKGAKTLEVSATANEGSCEDRGNADATNLNNLIAQIINIFSVIVGIIAVIMIIWGGLKFITAGGDSGRVTSARQTIIYALIGLIIVALAQFIVRFVLATTTDTVS